MKKKEKSFKKFTDEFFDFNRSIGIGVKKHSLTDDGIFMWTKSMQKALEEYAKHYNIKK